MNSSKENILKNVSTVFFVHKVTVNGVQNTMDVQQEVPFSQKLASFDQSWLKMDYFAELKPFFKDIIDI